MALTPEQIETIITLWKYSEQQADPRSKEDQITSGLREKSLLSCQYWIKGVGSVCSYWDGTKCTYECTLKNFPSGYNKGNCDYLGRRSECDKYNGTVDNENYTCIAPNIFLSGLGKIAGQTSTGYEYAPIPKEEIKGYCDGNCDGQGMGTGCDGIPGVSPVICNYYRPWQMGFGSLEPRQIRHTYKDGLIVIESADIEKAFGEVFDPMVKRLPFAFDVYNLRAQFQKCAHWDSDYGSFFDMDDIFGYISSDEDLESLCTCGDEKASPYHTLKNSVGAGVNKEWLLQDVWSEANTVICNGAKPECPCYTGEWKYCNDLHMYTGARITANLVFELRFWADYWENQEEYDKYFRKRPNLQDTPTPSIYTFTKWQSLGETAADSVAEGRILSLNIGSAAADENKRFYPEIYVASIDIQYSSAGINIGTTAPDENQIYYPSLIRNIYGELGTDLIDGCLLQIIYPYSSNEPFLEDKTEFSPSFVCMKKGSNIAGDVVSVIGFSIREKQIYAFNLEKLGSTLVEFGEHMDVSTLSQERIADEDGNFTGFSPREKFNLKIEEFINNSRKTNPDDIVSGSTDSNGYFNLGPLKLDYGKDNKIVVCIKYAPSFGYWDFRARTVQSVWYGGVLLQTSLEYDGNNSTLPIALTPPATITGKALCSPLSCSLKKIINSYYYKFQNHLFEEHHVTSYFYKKVERSNVPCDAWKRIGNTGYVWAEIEDTNINTIFRWGFMDATMTFVDEDTDAEISIPMERVDIVAEFISGLHPVPPSAVIMKIKEGEEIPVSAPQVFWKQDWTLKVRYWFTKITEEEEEEEEEEGGGEEGNEDGITEEKTVLWPDITSNKVHLKNNCLLIDIGLENNFTIKNVSNQTPAIFGIFADEDGRIVSTMATKMLIQIADTKCRNVEIFYKYSGPASKFQLLPKTGGNSFRENGRISATGENMTHFYTPICGDHENGKNRIKNGPMWFPYDSCKFCDFYRCNTAAAFCTAYFPCNDTPGGSPSNLLRYCGPPLYQAYASENSSLAFCHNDFSYSYSKMEAASTTFGGYANIVHWVDIYDYKSNGWFLPPFGNKGRDMVIKYLSQDYIHHITYKGEQPATTSKWVPMVPTLDDFLMPIGSFDEVAVINNRGIFHTNQLNFFTSDLIEEEIGKERYRFEDVFGTRRMFAVSYPTPDPYSIQYYFKDEDVVWAWQEHWKEIEYINRELYFVYYTRPDYKYDFLKVEHRYICAEGGKSISFTAPTTAEGYLIEYPSLCLGGGPRRYFNIIYDSHVGYVDWEDENGGIVGGGSHNIGEDGKPEKNIYEETSPTANGSRWNHDSNCLFDTDAVKTYEDAEAAGRKYTVLDDQGEQIDYYYNRGIIINIKKENLVFLPCTEYDFNLSDNLTDWTDSNVGGKGKFNYYGIAPHFVYDIFDIKEEKTFNEPEHLLCVSEIKITGLWGLDKVSNILEYGVCIPGIEIIEVCDTITNTIVSKESVNYNKDTYGEDLGLNSYEFVFKLEVTPERMFRKHFYNSTTLQINLSAFSDQYIYLNMIEFKVSKYVDTTLEIIKVYERRYVPSKGGNIGDWNINGPKVPYGAGAPDQFILQHDLDLDNSGTYIAVHPQLCLVPSQEFESRDKMRAGYASEQYYEREKIDINMSTIIQVESEKQKEIYEGAYNRDVDGNLTSLSFTKPVYFKSFGCFNLDFNGFLDLAVSIPNWDEHWLSSVYKVGAPWNPGGHFWKWSSDVEMASCYTYVTGSPGWTIKKHPLQHVIYVHADMGREEEVSNMVVVLYANRLQYKLDVAEKLGYLDKMDVGNLTGSAIHSFTDSVSIADN